MQLPHLLVKYCQIIVAHFNICLCCSGMTFSANRPEPEGVSSAELYTPTVVTSQMATNVSLLVPQDKVDGEEEEIDKEGEEEMTKGNVQLEGLLSLINETRFNVSYIKWFSHVICSLI